MDGREFKELKAIGNGLIRELGRLADANEAIVSLATDQREEVNREQPGPPFCPHCGRFNPPVQQIATGGGPMAEFVLAARCVSCGETFYAVPEGWQVVREANEARELLTEGGSDNGIS